MTTAAAGSVRNQANWIDLTEEFQEALGHLERGHNLFLTGKAGTGKSTLIRHFLENTSRNVVVAAPTGIAALNVNGYTIHRLFSFSTTTTIDDVESRNYYPRRFAKTLGGLETLIIDEASMVRADLFDMLEAALRRFGPRRGEPFGGVQLVLVGDLFQLPPVVTDGELEYFSEEFPTPYFFSAKRFSRDSFPMVHLTRVFRQQGDSSLVEILNAVRKGHLLEDVRGELNQAVDENFEPPVDDFWLTLTTTNRIATARNNAMLAKLPGPVVHFEARTSGQLDDFPEPTDRVLQLAVGAQVMLLTNDPGDRWVNGTIGRIEKIEGGPGEPRVMIRTNDGDVVEVENHTWEVTRPVINGGRVSHEVVGAFTQLPLRLAWAITIHKSQGQTLDKVVVDLSGGTFANGQLYVALSRCTNFQGLVLKRPVLPKDLRVDNRIRRFLATGHQSTSKGYAFLSVLTIGSAGRIFTPRPVEIAAMTSDGRTISTLINPTCDLYNAREDYGIEVSDIQFAPILAEAWPALQAQLEGYIPVALDCDVSLGWVDSELKRGNHVALMPLGINIDKNSLLPHEQEALSGPTALERARAVWAAAHRLAVTPGPETAPFSGGEFGSGYLLPRGEWPATLLPDDGSAPSVEQLVQNLKVAVKRAHLDGDAVDRLREAEALLGAQILDPELETMSQVEIAAVFIDGARVCFTGTVMIGGRTYARADMEEFARSAGYAPVANVTKTRCDVLVVAEAGTQSGKAKKAIEYGKPIFTASEFFEFLGQK